MLSALRAQVLRKSNKAPPPWFLSRTPGFVCNDSGACATETSDMSVEWCCYHGCCTSVLVFYVVVNNNIAANRSMAGVALRKRMRLLVEIRSSVVSTVEIYQQPGPPFRVGLAAMACSTGVPHVTHRAIFVVLCNLLFLHIRH